MIEPETAEAKGVRPRVRTPRGLCLTGVDYSAYEQIRESRGNSGLRMAYSDGVLWIMSPQYRHEKGTWLLGPLIDAYAMITKLDCEAAGATTFKKGKPGQPKGKGKEGDATFYLGAVAAKVRNKDHLDIAVDPPPSLWIEVDNYGNTKAKLPLYAALGIPEVWQYRVRRKLLKFWRLENGQYHEVPESLALPGLTPARVLDLLEQAGKRGRTQWIGWLLNDWFPQNRALFPDFQNQQP